MLTFISCAKTMTARTSVGVPEITVPYFQAEAVQNALDMGQFSAADLERLLRINSKIAAENYLRYQDFFSEANSALPAICDYTGAQFENIIVGNGSTELISLFIQSTHPKKALILGPTYSEYEREITLEGGHTLYYPLKEENDFQMNVDDFCHQLNDSIDLLVLCNPNNPTASAITKKEMRKILDTALQYGLFVMGDETYVEFAPDAEFVLHSAD